MGHKMGKTLQKVVFALAISFMRISGTQFIVMSELATIGAMHHDNQNKGTKQP